MDGGKIGRFIRELRNEKGLTQDELANIIKVDRTFVSRWERGITIPDISYIQDLAKIFNVTTDELIEGKRNNKKENVDDKIKKAVNYYEKRNIKRFVFVSIVLLLVVSAIVVTARVVRERTFFVMDELHIKKDDFEINGYFMSNEEESYLLLNDIMFVDMYVGTVDEIKISKIEIILQDDKDELIRKTVEIGDGEPNEISKVFSELHLFYNPNKKKLDKSTLLLIINYIDIDGILKTTKISLKG